MRTMLLAGVAVGAVLAGPALGADLRRPVTKAPPPVAIYNWTGFYIGAHVGGAWGDKDWSIEGDSLGSHDVSGLIAGGQLGFNWQAPGSNWVLGIEGQASWADVDGDHVFEDDFNFRTKVEWLATVAGRLGYAWDRVLIYAKGGAAFAGEKHKFFFTDEPDFVLSGDKTRTGWMVGGGIEIALAGNWSVKGEYNFMDFGDKGVTLSNAGESLRFDIDQQIHVAKFGINYRFGGPLVARY